MYTIGEQMASDCHTLTFLFQQDYLSFDTAAARREGSPYYIYSEYKYYICEIMCIPILLFIYFFLCAHKPDLYTIMLI